MNNLIHLLSWVVSKLTKQMGKKDYLKNKYQNVHIYEHHYHVKSAN